MVIYGTEIKQSDTAIEFFKTGGKSQVLLEWDATKIKGLECFFRDGGFYGLNSNIEILDDGIVGRGVINFEVRADETGQGNEGVASFHFSNEDDTYRQIIEVNVIQKPDTFSNYVAFDTNALFVPAYFQEISIPYTINGGVSISEIQVPEGSGIYAADIPDASRISLMTHIENADFFGGNIIKEDAKIILTNGTEKTIHIWMLKYLVQPIWKDIDAEIMAGKDSLEYKIFNIQGNDEPESLPIYTGVAYKMPDADRVKININKVVEPFLYQNIIMGKEGLQSQYNYGKPFAVVVDGKPLATYAFFNEWTYSPFQRRYGLKYNMNSYINNEIVRGQLFTANVWTCSKNPNNEITYIQESAEPSYNYTPIEGYKYTPNAWEYTTVQYNTKGLKPESKYLLCVNSTYKIIEPCGIEYVLHFLDKEGGYSSFPIKANVNRKSKSKSHMMNQTFNNTTTDFEEKKYLNEIYDEWEVTLPLLSRYEAGKIDEILQSTQVWLERIKDNKIVPVMVEGDNIDFKNNQKIRNYTITLRASQSKLRK